jgi:hypothetical protein
VLRCIVVDAYPPRNRRETFKRVSVVALFATFLAGFMLIAAALGRPTSRGATTVRLASVQPDQARAHDRALATPPEFTPTPGAGNYQLTPPGFTPAGFTQTRNVTPFVLKRPNQFRPAAPPALTSTRYAVDFAEERSLGEATGSTRTADPTSPCSGERRRSGSCGTRWPTRRHCASAAA